MFEAATTRRPEESVRLEIGRDARKTLDGYDAEPWQRLLVSYEVQGLAGDDTPNLDFPARKRTQADATRPYIERPWWRRIRR